MPRKDFSQTAFDVVRPGHRRSPQDATEAPKGNRAQGDKGAGKESAKKPKKKASQPA